MMQDVRYALRGFRRNPVLTGAIVLTLAFGIGMNTGVFSVLTGMVMRARVEKDPATFFQVLANSPEGARLFGSSIAEFEAYRAQARHASDLSAWAVAGARVDDDGRPSLAMLVSCDFFALYGLERARLGRLFDAKECAAPAAVAVLGEELWRTRFYANPAIVGTSILLNGRAFTVAGIVPARFSGRLRGPGIWVPLTMQPHFYGGVDLFREAGHGWLTVEGRVRPGASAAEVRADLERAAPRKVTLTNGSLIEMPGVRTMAALGLILLLACTNVTMLLLSRADARRYEMGVRLALGASRGRLLRMAATEGVLLALFAGGIAAFVAGWVPAGVEHLVPTMPHYPMHPDWIVFAYLAGITLLAGCAAGLMPAAESLRANLVGSLKHQESGLSAGRARWRLRDLLIAAQVAMSMVLLVGAALFVRTEYRLFAADPGFDARHVMLMPVPAGSLAAVEQRIRALPEARLVASAESLPYGRPQAIGMRLPGGAVQPAVVTAVSPGFFATLGIALAGGRELNDGDVRGAVVPESFAARFWSLGKAVGAEFETDDGARWRVVGVTRDSDLERHGTGTGPRFYLLAGNAQEPRVLLVRFAGDADAAGRAIRAVYRELQVEERELPRTLEAEIGEMGARFRATVAIALFLGGSAFLLAVVGVYGVIAFAVSRRMKEMGIRLALGATRGRIVQTVLESGARPVAAGLAAGLPLAMAGALALARAFRDTPVPIAAWDGIAFGGVALILAVAAGVAMVRPAWKASGCDPAVTLRDD
jgi:predicted permease